MVMGPEKPTPKPKGKLKKITMVRRGYLTNVSPTTKAKLDLKKAIDGGAKKTARKLAPRDKVETYDYASDYSTGNSTMRTGIPLGRSKPKKYTSAKQKAKRNMIAGNIINDLSKTAMRAKIVEMNAIKKRKKK
jgi:hypothetical protein